MTTVTISLPESLRDFVFHQVKTKGYGNVSEFFRGLLREAQQQEEKRRLEALLLEGLNCAGEDLEVHDEFWKKLKAEAAGLIKRRKSA
jgi:antitoxin ParD1/3/4